MKKLTALFLTLLLLVGLAACGGEPTAPEETGEDTSSDSVETVTVSTVGELAAAIGNDTRIILKEGLYNFSELQNETWENSNLESDSYLDGSGNEMLGYRITGVSNLTIEAQSGGEVEVVTELSDGPVLYFENCSNITVKDLLCGHTVEAGGCHGGVIQADFSENINIEGCRLYGSGTYGVEAYGCKGMTIENTQIYECTNGILSFSTTTLVKVLGCELFNNTGFSMLCFYECGDVLVEDCRIHDNACIYEEGYPFIDYYGSQGLRFVNCAFADNYPEVQGVDTDEISFEDCTVSPWEGEQGDNSKIQIAVQNHPLMVVAEIYKMMDSNYYQITLSDADAEQFPYLQPALDVYQDISYQQQQESLLENAAFLDEIIAEGSDVTGYEGVVLQFTRADAEAFSYLVEDNIYLGGSHGSVSYSAVNLDPKTGSEIPLSSVVIQKEGFAQIIYEELLRQSEKLQVYFEQAPSERGNLILRLEEGLENPETFPAWAIGYSGLHINFDDYALGSYAAGAAWVIINYADYPEYFADKYFYSAESVPDIGEQVMMLPDADLETIYYY